MTFLDKINGKIIFNWDLLPDILESWKKADQKIVFTNGCFDIIHRGHIELLSKAADLGDKLVVGLNSDASVHRLKGTGRPLQDENSRALIMAGFGFIDLVVLFHHDTPFELISLIKPGILVKGGDYKAEEIVGYDIVTKNNGQVVIINFLEGYSTTSIVNKLKD
jgi:rfaE bifunctional protein nucleotidyltransferase chain/domain